MVRRKQYVIVACKKKTKKRRARKKRGAGKIRKKYRRRRTKKINFFGSGDQNTPSKKSGKSPKSKQMSQTLFKKKMSLFKIMRDLPLDQQIVLLHHLDSRACNDIRNCVKKVISGKHLSEEQSSQLKNNLLPYKPLLRDIVKTPSKGTKELIPQLGGGLSLLLSTGIPILIDIARKKKWI